MFQQLIIVGNLGKDPEMRYTPSGQAVTNFSVATSYTYMSKGGERVSETTWFRVATWGKLAEACNQYLKKGSRVLVVGRLTGDKETGGPRVFETSSGKAGANYEVTAETVRFLSSSAQATSGPSDSPEDDEPF